MLYRFFPFPFFPSPFQPGRPPGPGPGRPPGPGGNYPSPPPFSPGGGNQSSKDEPPKGPPPASVPKKPSSQPGLKAVDPGAVRYCKYKYTYLWLEDGRSFWAWPTYIGRRSLSGYRWLGFRWVYFGVDLEQITDFVCY